MAAVTLSLSSCLSVAFAQTIVVEGGASSYPLLAATLVEVRFSDNSKFIPADQLPAVLPPVVPDRVAMPIAPEGIDLQLRVSLVNTSTSDTFLYFPFGSGTVANRAIVIATDARGRQDTLRLGRLEPASRLSLAGVPPPARTLRRLYVPLVLPQGVSTELTTVYTHDSRYGARLYLGPELVPVSAVTQRYAGLWDTYRRRAFYQGLLWMFVGFSLLNFLLRRELAYLFYGGYVLSLSLVMSFALLENTMPIFVMPDWPTLANWLYHLGAGGMVVFYLLFLQSFLQAQSVLPHWHKGMVRLALLGALVTVVFQLGLLFPQYGFGYRINSAYIAAILVFIAVGIGYLAYLARWRNPLTRFVLGATVFLFCGSVPFALSFLGVDFGFAGLRPQLVMQAATIMELSVFLVGLAYRDRLIEGQRARAAAFASLQARFFANVSHEFRTPLTLILAPVGDALREGQTPKLQQTFQLVDRNARRLLELVTQVLDLARLDASSTMTDPVPTDVARFVGGLAEELRSLADRRAIDYKVRLSPKLPTLLLDRDLVEKITVNLLSNAIKFAPAGGVVTVDLNYDGALVLRVCNNGEALDERDRQHLFDRFYQGRQRSPSGIGLGLSLVGELVQLLGGSIDVRSDTSETCFAVRLPLALTEHEPVGIGHLEPTPNRDPASDADADADADASTRATLGRSGDTILVVEDHPDMRQYLASVLAGDYRVTQAADGRAALEIIEAHPPDLVLSDVVMPVLGGHSLCERLKRDPATSHIPVVLITAQGDEEARRTSWRYGADEHLTKPIDSEDLRLRIGNLLVQRRRLRASFGQATVGATAEDAHDAVELDWLARATGFVEAQLPNPQFTIEDFAAGLHLSRTQLHRKLTALTDLNATDFVRELRLRRAAALLTAGVDNVSQVGFRVGFNSPSYFAKCFRARYGCAPSAFGAEGLKREV